MNLLEFLNVFDTWLQGQPSIVCAAMVGSRTNGSSRPESDVDLCLLTDDIDTFTANRAWLKELLPTATNLALEQWGPVRTLRFFLGDLEIELNFATTTWANTPVDPGTANVVTGGLTLLKDPYGVAAKLLEAVNDADIVNVRTHTEADAESLARIFHSAVHNIDESLYSPAQKNAWSPEVTAERIAHWQSRIETTRPFVAEYQDRVVGFIELEANGHIDCFYTNPSVHRKGIGQMLFQQAVNEARGFGLKTLYVEASHIAKPFFEKNGFTTERENTVSINGVSLTNFIMHFNLEAITQWQT